MSSSAIWLAFILAGVVTFSQRSLFFWLGEGASQRLLPDPLQRALRFVAPAAFAAIALPRVINPSDAGLVDPVGVVTDAKVIAAAVACIVMWRVGRLPVMLVVGMGLFWMLRVVGL